MNSNLKTSKSNVTSKTGMSIKTNKFINKNKGKDSEL